MDELTEYRFGIDKYKQPEGCWSFGMCFSHSFGETYLYINFAKWTISIGRLWKHKEDEDDK